MPPTEPSSSIDRDDTRGVASVVGAILLVAVTVVLASTIGTFVLGFTSDLPRDESFVDFRISHDETTVVLTHAGGATLDGEDVYVVSESGDWLGNFAGTDGQACDTTIPSVTAGIQCQISGSPSGELSVIWRSDDRSSILFRGEGIDAGPTPTPTPTDTPPTATIDQVTDRSVCRGNDCVGRNRAEFAIDWSASDDDGLESVTIELVDSDGTVVSSDAPNVGGTNASGTTTVTDAGGYTQVYTIVVTATDSGSHLDPASEDHTADGDATGSPP